MKDQSRNARSGAQGTGPQGADPHGSSLDTVPASGQDAERAAVRVADFVAPTEDLRVDDQLTAGFKEAFGQHPAGVAIITVKGPEGPVGSGPEVPVPEAVGAAVPGLVPVPEVVEPEAPGPVGAGCFLGCCASGAILMPS